MNNAFENVYATAYVYFECMLAGSIVCGMKAARWKPSMDKDFIVILGCWFRKDGSLPPLLRGKYLRKKTSTPSATDSAARSIRTSEGIPITSDVAASHDAISAPVSTYSIFIT